MEARPGREAEAFRDRLEEVSIHAEVACQACLALGAYQEDRACRRVAVEHLLRIISSCLTSLGMVFSYLREMGTAGEEHERLDFGQAWDSMRIALQRRKMR